jgi:hypothetical protein
MLSCFAIILNTENGKREILVTPFPLQSTEPPKIKSGKISKLFFYENWDYDEYRANLNQEHIAEKFKTDRFILNVGQDFGKYYLGCLSVDADSKRYWGWQGSFGKLDDDAL